MDFRKEKKLVKHFPSFFAFMKARSYALLLLLLL